MLKKFTNDICKNLKYYQNLPLQDGAVTNTLLKNHFRRRISSVFLIPQDRNKLLQVDLYQRFHDFSYPNKGSIGGFGCRYVSCKKIKDKKQSGKKGCGKSKKGSLCPESSCRCRTPPELSFPSRVKMDSSKKDKAVINKKDARKKKCKDGDCDFMNEE